MNDSERKENFEWLKIHFDSLRNNLALKSGLIPTVASLSATLLVIATFNNQLIVVTPTVKVVLIVLLMLIPISLSFSIIEYHFAIQSEIRSIEKIVGVKIDIEEVHSFERKLWNRILYYFPFFAILVLTIAIVFISVQVWNDPVISQDDAKITTETDIIDNVKFIEQGRVGK